jgi:hypothetical protein
METKSTSRHWLKSQRCAEGPNCVEISWDAAEVWVRDSKDPQGPVLRFTHSEWAAFVAGAKEGDFDIRRP